MGSRTQCIVRRMAFSTMVRTGTDARIRRLVNAAGELANETGSAAFTVQQVVERAGLSLKSFYRCFDSKDDLLLALLADASRAGAEILAGALDVHRAPAERLRAYIEGIFALAVVPGAEGYAGVLAREHRRLSEARPGELARALAPLVDLLATEVSSVPTADVAADTDAVFTLVIGGIHDVIVGGAVATDRAAHLWRFCWSGLGGAPCR